MSLVNKLNFNFIIILLPYYSSLSIFFFFRLYIQIYEIDVNNRTYTVDVNKCINLHSELNLISKFR